MFYLRITAVASLLSSKRAVEEKDSSQASKKELPDSVHDSPFYKQYVSFPCIEEANDEES
jgi:hypothetical protein